MMIILAESGVLEKSEVYASDINMDVIDIAREGKYKYRFNQLYIENFNEVINVDHDMHPSKKKISADKYLAVDKANNLIEMRPFLTRKPVYKKIDLVKEENLFKIKFDIIICRNVIIYFNSDLQNRIFNLFYQNLEDDGCMVLGIHESVLGPYAANFEKRNQVYYKRITE
jgi:chemotaxis protein methyltransferase CheR